MFPCFSNNPEQTTNPEPSHYTSIALFNPAIRSVAWCASFAWMLHEEKNTKQLFAFAAWFKRTTTLFIQAWGHVRTRYQLLRVNMFSNRRGRTAQSLAAKCLHVSGNKIGPTLTKSLSVPHTHTCTCARIHTHTQTLLAVIEASCLKYFPPHKLILSN